ncbi:protein adenylyltransferase SelO family protein [Duganella vulcania]|uniref:MchC protein n=1 Tax=Duganella vulcania TaxID=2692166 RepID=A0A845GP56_9BURK|nr:protein adenylyltransferase SelO family protein [Duganella vulcania]MYM95200.1 hypothetical protein [Duganella vulcania]
MNLPATSYVPFSCAKLKNFKILWQNRAVGTDVPLENYAFCVPALCDQESDYDKFSITAFAERYGGKGVGTNGGGVRCGNIGDWQIKGVGCNPLVGMGTDYWHAHGGATIDEAIKEVIWSEICSFTLPYGAIRTAGIILTGTKTWKKERDKKTIADRALIIREKSIRPAHFMRSVNYNPNDLIWSSCVSDNDRTKNSINSLTRNFPMPSDVADPAKNLYASIYKLLKRAAFQMAAARAKRIPHGSINCSNICLDGRYIDFGTMTAISDFGRVIISGGNPDLWNEEIAVRQTLENIYFSVLKYESDINKVLPNVDYFWAEFQRIFSDRLCIEFLKLTGIPEFYFEKIPLEAKISLWKVMIKIISHGNREPFRLTENSPVKFGSYHLNTILQIASLSRNKAELTVDLKNHISETLVNEFSDSYWNFRNECNLELSEAKFSNKVIAIRSIFLNGENDFLSKYKIDGEIEKMIEDGIRSEDIGIYIEKTIKKSENLFQSSDTLTSYVNTATFGRICFGPNGVSDEKRQEIDYCGAIDMLPEEIFSKNFLNRLKAE